ncbi:CLUMA_CG016868, isoform A [Clunio marinus]|uniref:CLUMA_CG016868, isoform A n=1 Tax=Clunio marinus TaxID=568069 RepID=A0A1J1IVC3_9DIPT|nr:CLUMA_CG016868, isoform A [Clunio marinus]
MLRCYAFVGFPSDQIIAIEIVQLQHIYVTIFNGILQHQAKLRHKSQLKTKSTEGNTLMHLHDECTGALSAVRALRIYNTIKYAFAVIAPA